MFRSRDSAALAAAAENWRDDIENFVAEQFLFDRQWKAVKAYANERNISIVGDMPIYVGAQSADVWCFPDLFELGDTGAPVIVSGVPPDAFSETGQLWGSPLYDWQVNNLQVLLRLVSQESLHALLALSIPTQCLILWNSASKNPLSYR